MDNFCFSISGMAIPTLSEQPVKSLGKFFDRSLKDTAAIQKARRDLKAW